MAPRRKNFSRPTQNNIRKNFGHVKRKKTNTNSLPNKLKQWFATLTTNKPTECEEVTVEREFEPACSQCYWEKNVVETIKEPACRPPLTSDMKQVVSFIVDSALKFGRDNGVVVPEQGTRDVYRIASPDGPPIKIRVPEKSFRYEDAEKAMWQVPSQDSELSPASEAQLWTSIKEYLNAGGKKKDLMGLGDAAVLDEISDDTISIGKPTRREPRRREEDHKEVRDLWRREEGINWRQRR